MRRLPALSALGVLGVVVAAATAGGIGEPAPRSAEAGFETVAPEPGVPAGSDGPPDTAAIESDDTVPADVPVLTVPRPGVLPGFDGAAFDAALADRILDQGALAVSIAVAKDGHLIHTGAYGIANPFFAEPVTPSHRFRIASNSKVVTGATVLALVADGKLDLDEPVLHAEVGAMWVRTVSAMHQRPGYGWTVPELADLPVGCPFAERCAWVVDDCLKALPAPQPVAPGHDARCIRLAAVAADSA